MPKGVYTRTEQGLRNMSLARQGFKHTQEAIEKIKSKRKLQVITPEHKEAIRQAHLKSGLRPPAPIFGRKLSQETISKIRIGNMGNKNFLGKTHSIETRKKIGIGHSGVLCTFWKGGVSNINDRIRHSISYIEWRKKVFERDNYTCQDCNTRGGHLNADHIKPFSVFPELRFEVSNGRTLCEECHKKTDTYGGKVYLQYPQLISRNRIKTI